MNVTFYTVVEASELVPGSIILDVDEHDAEHPEVAAVPTAYLVDEIADRLDGRTIYGRPTWRTGGKRRRWSMKPDNEVSVELPAYAALDLLREIPVQHPDVHLVVVAGGRPLADMQAERSSE